MKFVLMMNCPRNGYEALGEWPKEALTNHIAFMHRLNRSLLTCSR